MELEGGRPGEGCYRGPQRADGRWPREQELRGMDRENIQETDGRMWLLLGGVRLLPDFQLGEWLMVVPVET